jgi:serine/threonine protein kinase
VVTRWYRSPELLLHCRGAGAAPTDMWSIGCILAELLLGEPLFPGESEQEVIDLILHVIGSPEHHDCEWINNRVGHHYVTHYPSMPGQNFQQKFTHANTSTLDLLTKLLTFNPTKRITAEQALQHPFFASLFKSQDVVTFPLKPISAADRVSSNRYHQFETQLEDAEGLLSSEITHMAHELILEEIDRYRLELSPGLTALAAPSSDSASAVVSSIPDSLFYFDNHKADVSSTEVVTKEELRQKNS